MKIAAWLIIAVNSLLFLLIILSIPNSAHAATKMKGLSESQLDTFAQNNILFYDPGECIEGGSNPSGLCGDTPGEKYWSVLRGIFDSTHAAAIFGSMDHEGSGPTLWQFNIVPMNSGQFDGVTWDDLYNCPDGGCPGGVGSFQITWELGTYLKYVSKNNPDLLKYFQDPSYSLAGEEALKKIGAADFGRLVEQEINFFLESRKGSVEDFKKTTDLYDAADYWTKNIENCADCCGAADTDHSCEQIDLRRASAQKEYDEMGSYTCTSSNGSEKCNKLSELRTKMWTNASQADRESFMKVVEEENHSIAGVEGYMNQIISGYWTDGEPTLHDWLNGQCEAFRPEDATCTGKHTITNEEQDWINQALNGSNNIKFAVGNATGGSDEVGAGKIICVWDGTKCRDDVDYTKDGGMGVCNVYSPSEDFGECWGLEDAESWVEDMSNQCGSGSSSNTATATTSASSTTSTTSSNTISGNDITWIGDSYSVGALNEIKSKFPGVDLGTENPGNTSSPYSNIQVGKHLDASADEGSGGKSGTAILKEIKDSGKLRPYLVLALGTNDQNTTEETAKSILDYVANEVGDTKVILTTALTNVPDNKDNSYYSELNNTIKSFANSHSNFEFADWESAAKDKKEEYYKNDNLHPTNGDGYDVWLGTISDALDKTPTSNSNSSNTNVGVCGNTTTVNVSIGDKGLTVEQAQKIADYYNSNAVTAKNFIGNDIPSSYQKVNCVSFSLWFVSAFTDASDNGATWNQLVNDGAYIASTGLPSIGWTTGNNPTPFSVFGGTGSEAWSHTGVVVGVDEDGKIITIEAAYAEHDAQVGTRDPSYFASGVGILAYPGEHFTPSKGHLGNKSFNEILGN